MSNITRGRSYRIVTDQHNEESGNEEGAVVRWRNKPVGGGVNVFRGKRSLKKSGLYS